jgi:SAM-dependent methyltransferase
MLNKSALVEHMTSYGLRHFDSDEYWDWAAAKLGKHAARIDRLRERSDDSPERLREFMDYVAAPQIRGVVGSLQTDDLAQAVWAVAQRLVDRHRILDVGCDVGMASAWFARLDGENRQVVGLDFAPKAIAAAREMATRLGVRNVQFCVSDFEQSLPEGPFDAVVEMASVQYARDPASVYQRIRKVLGPSGVLISVPMIGRADELECYLQALRDAGFRVRSFDFVYARDLGRNIARPIVEAAVDGDSLEIDAWSVMRAAAQRVSGPRITPFFEAASA